MPEIQLFDVVALVEDIPDMGLRRGQVGTVIEVWEAGVFEVEFSGLDGVTYTISVVRANQLMVLHYSPLTVS